MENSTGTGEAETKYNIGQQFLQRFPTGKKGKYVQRLCTVTDIRRTYNSKDELVSINYVAEHEFMGCPMTDYRVTDTTISRALWEASK